MFDLDLEDDVYERVISAALSEFLQKAILTQLDKLEIEQGALDLNEKPEAPESE